ncbi:nuclear transport factor 2 family protein [Rhodoferax sp.]|uniref:nuclear transport factor 2 family protein n=1 Tax=Rhodoferax sp. TaxID=50421 RepID=UPI00374D9484
MLDLFQDTANRVAIDNLLHRWGHARDSEDLAVLDACFHPDARIHLSWIYGPATEFVQGSRLMAAGRRYGAHMKHITASPWIELRGARAVCRSNAFIIIRDCVAGHWFDLESHMRFFDILELRDSHWHIVELTAVYDKDRIDPVSHDPSLTPPWAAMRAAVPDPVMHVRWWLASRGLQPRDDVACVYSPEETALRMHCLAWLEASQV